MPKPLQAFVLTRQWRDTPEGLALGLWMVSEAGPLRVRVTGQQAVMFVARGTRARCARKKPLALRSLDGAAMDAAYFDSQSAMLDERDRLRGEGIAVLEGDIKPADRYLMERFITGGCQISGPVHRQPGFLTADNPRLEPGDYRPAVTVMSIDIETDGASGPIVSIAALSEADERVFMVGDGPKAPSITYVPSESVLLQQFFAHVAARDPDVLIGWNVVEFDLAHIQRRCQALGASFDLGRGRERAAVLAPRAAGGRPTRSVARLPGRMALDGISLLKAATHSFERYSLEHVANRLLGRGKQIDKPKSQTGDGAEARIEEIRRLYREDKLALAEYNIEDCRLVRDIFQRTELLSFAIERQRMTGLLMDRLGGSVAAFDYLYLPRLHRKGFVAGTIAAPAEAPPSPGGYVLPSQPGLYNDVLVLDFKSLYPSIIRTFKIDPLGLAYPNVDPRDPSLQDPHDTPIAGFDGARFSRTEHILPELIAALWRDRDRAKGDRNEALSRAIKILMNSFYGVLGTSACRFFSPLLATSITRRGHELITRSRDWIIARGYPVIYGDTDSLFVHVETGSSRPSPAECQRIGQTLADELNTWWRDRLREEHQLESFLEMEMETHYLRFFMPTLRGSDKGSAKRYAGLVADGDGDGNSATKVVIKGLEAVRRDWTPLARNFQRELLRRALCGEPVEAFVREARRSLLGGELDDELVYHRRLRRDVASYKRNPPPHVRAARMLARPVREISYVWTTRGPEPIEKRASPPSYEHYLERQLAPAADSILNGLGTSFEAIAGDQLELFQEPPGDES